MRTTTYSAIERGVASIAGIDPDNVLAHEKSILAEYINDAVNYCWDYYPWGEFTITEKRYFRDVWSSSTPYQLGSEVYHVGKFYRMHGDGNSNTEPSKLLDWYEIGDRTEDSPWSEDGLYGIGARLSHNDKSYVCIALSPLGKTNYLTDGIEVTNTTYFQEVDTFFERYIPYEQTGFNTIGNCHGIYTNDPRYSNTQHLNFREGREGIYIEAMDSIINEIWMVYKIESPTFTPTSTESTIPRFLAQAIKAHAYQSWLVGEGQHEKAGLQELKILDLLVREVDKIDLQANKNKPFSISPNSSEIINSRQSQISEPTPHLIGKLVEAESDLTFKLGSSIQGRNPYIKSTLDLTFKLSVPEIQGQDILDPLRKYGTTLCHSNFGVSPIVSHAIKSTSVNTIPIKLSASASGRDYGQSTSVDPIAMTLVVDPPYGNRVLASEADLSFGLNVAPIEASLVFASQIDINMAINVEATDRMIILEQQLNTNYSEPLSLNKEYMGIGGTIGISLTDKNTYLGLGQYKLSIDFLSLQRSNNLAGDDAVVFDQNEYSFVTNSSQSTSNSDGRVIQGDVPLWLFLINHQDMKSGIDATLSVNGVSQLSHAKTPENNTGTNPLYFIDYAYRQNIRGTTTDPQGVSNGTQYIDFDPLPYDPTDTLGSTYKKAYWGGTAFQIYPTYSGVTEMIIDVNSITNLGQSGDATGVHVAIGFQPGIKHNSSASYDANYYNSLRYAKQIVRTRSVQLEKI